MSEMENGIDITLEVVCGKWTGAILWQLLHKDRLRFNELRRSLNGSISSRILSRELRKLIKDGLVERVDFETMPPRVEYCITPYGKTTASFLESMNEWGMAHKRMSASKSEMADMINTNTNHNEKENELG